MNQKAFQRSRKIPFARPAYNHHANGFASEVGARALPLALHLIKIRVFCYCLTYRPVKCLYFQAYTAVSPWPFNANGFDSRRCSTRPNCSTSVSRRPQSRRERPSRRSPECTRGFSTQRCKRPTRFCSSRVHAPCSHMRRGQGRAHVDDRLESREEALDEEALQDTREERIEMKRKRGERG